MIQIKRLQRQNPRTNTTNPPSNYNNKAVKAHSVDKSPNVLKFQTFRVYTIELLGQLSTQISKHRAVPAFVIKNRGTGGRSRSTCALLRVRPMKAVNSGSNRYQDIRSGERTYTQTTTTGQSRCWVDGIRLIYCLAMIGSRGGRAGGGGQPVRWTAGLVCVSVHKHAVLSHLLWVRIQIS